MCIRDRVGALETSFDGRPWARLPSPVDFLDDSQDEESPKGLIDLEVREEHLPAQRVDGSAPRAGGIEALEQHPLAVADVEAVEDLVPRRIEAESAGRRTDALSD